jgi:hypothetical protein
MRMPFLAAIPVLAALSAAPAGAQVSARLHLDVPLGRRAPWGYGASRRQVIVREYNASRFGDWDNYYDDWAPVTLYYYDGYYYDYPVAEYAQPVVVYSYRNEFFLPPRERGFEIWRQQYRFGGNYRGASGYGRDSREFRSIPRDGRDGRQYQSMPRDWRDWRQFQSAPRDGRDGRQFQSAPRDGRDGRQFQSAPRDGRDGRQFQSAPRDGRDGRQFQSAPRDGGRQFQSAPRDGGRQVQPAPQAGGNGRDARQGGDRGNGRSRPRP